MGLSGRLFPVLLAMLIIMLPSVDASAAVLPGDVRVAVTRQSDNLSFKVSGNYQLVDQLTDKIITKLDQGENWEVKLEDNRLLLQGQRDSYGPFKGPVIVQELDFRASIISGDGEKVERNSASGLMVLNAEGRSVSLNTTTAPTVRSAGGVSALTGGGGINLVSLTGDESTRRYRGSLEFRVENGCLTAVNELNIEDYLRGVVPAEIPSAWPDEVLKAQAVAARNYVLQRVEATRGHSFNVADDQYSQVYKGYDAESPATDRAIEETRGIVMLSQGRLVTAFFHSSSGGFTENSEDVWKNPVPYIRAKADPFDKNDRHYNWQVDYTVEQLAGRLREAGYEFEKVTDIEELVRTSSGKRVEKIVVKGEDDKEETLRVEIFNADNVRIALGLKSALFTMDKTYDKDEKLTGVKFTGSGWGHGLGMSQWGAYGMAKQGYNYQDILKYYYSGINLAADYGRLPLSTGRGSSQP